MENKEIYEEYKQEHPEELTEVGQLFEYTARVERRRGNKKESKLREIQRCREVLNGNNTV